MERFAAYKKKLAGSVAAVLVAAMLFPFNPPAAQAAGVLDGKTYGDPVKVTVPISKVSINDAVIGMEDGKETAYTTATSDHAIFNVIDIRSNKLLRSFVLEGVHTTWRHAIAPDGTVYIAGSTSSSQGQLWSYSPVTKKMTNHGNPSPGEKSLWAMTIDDKGNVYGGTFDNGKVFKYDPVTKTYHDYGRMLEGRGYVRSMAYYDGHLYAGVGTVGDVVKMNVTTGEKEVISGPVASILGVTPANVPFAYDMAVVDDYLLVKFSDTHMALLFYDLKNKVWLDKKVDKQSGGFNKAGVFSFNQLQSLNGKLYILGNGGLLEVDMTTFEVRPTKIPYGSSLRGAEWMEFPDNPELPGKSLVTVQSSGKITIMNIEKETRLDLPAVVEGAPNPLHQIEPGPDGKLYMSGYPGGTGAVYDPKTGKNVNFTVGQAEGMVELGDYMYYGVYPGAIIYRSAKGTETPVVEEVFRIGSEQDRPYMMTTGAGKLIIGTIPDYGKLGGALTIYDPATGEKKVYRNIVENQSITGLVYRDGLIYGSTNIHGGLDIPTTATSAKMFVWDVASEKKIAEFFLPIPELDKPKMITGLTFGPDDLLWGFVDGIVFKLNPKTFALESYTNIYPDVKNYGFWRPYHPRWGEDGLMIVDLADRVTVINPKTMKHVQLTPNGQEIAFMALGKDAEGHENIYFNLGGVLMMIPVRGELTEGGQIRSLPVTNGSFELAGPAGWSNPYPTGLAFTRTNEKAAKGDYSVKIVDTDQSTSGGLLSDPIAIKPGKTYTASAQINVTGGKPDDAALMMYFYDAQGKEINNVSTALGNYTTDVWKNLEVTGIAPVNAASARIMLYSSRWSMITAYYDDVMLQSPDDVEVSAKPGQLKLTTVGHVGSQSQLVTANLTAEESNGLYALKAKIQYDPTVFSLEDVVAAPGFKDKGLMIWKDENGIVTIIATKLGNETIAAGENIASLILKPKGKFGATQLSLLSGAELADEQGDRAGDPYVQEAASKEDYEVVAFEMSFLVKVAKQIGKAVNDGNRSLDINKDGVIDISDLAIIANEVLKQ